MMSRQQLHHLSGAYVLGALEPDEARAFEERLPYWEDMRAEVVELADTAVALGLALPPVQPRREVRERLLAAVAVTPQPRDDGPAPAMIATRLAPADVAPRRRRRRARRLPVALGALAGLGVAAAALIAALQFGPELVNTPPALAEQVLAADDSRRLPVPLDGGAGVVLTYSDALDRSVLQWADLPALADGSVYQLWYVGDAARSAGLVDGSGTVLLDGGWWDGDRVGITVEPFGGSDQPTGDLVALTPPLTA